MSSQMTTTNMVISRIIYLNVEIVHHISPKCFDEVRGPSVPVIFGSIPSDIFQGERNIRISYLDDDISSVLAKAFNKSWAAHVSR